LFYILSRVFPGGRFEDKENFEEALIRELTEEIGIKIIKSSNESFEYTNILNQKIKVELHPFMLYESVYPEYLVKGLATSQCLALFYIIKIDTEKDSINITYQKDEIESITWINFEKLHSALFKKEKLIFSVYEYENGNSKPFKENLWDESILVNWEDKELGIPYGHSLAIKILNSNKTIN